MLEKEEISKSKNRKHDQPIFDDNTLENMMTYYRVDSYDAVLKYIKAKRLNSRDEY